MVVLPLPAPPWMTTRPESAARDQLELARIDQRGDLGQVAVEPLGRSGPVPEHAARRSPGRSPRYLARPPARCADLDPAPAALRSRTNSPCGAEMRTRLPRVDGDACGARATSPSTSRSPNVSSYSLPSRYGSRAGSTGACRQSTMRTPGSASMNVALADQTSRSVHSPRCRFSRSARCPK